MKLCRENHIPSAYHEYFDRLPVGSVTEENNEEDE